jgi:hypothetical protein
MSASLLPAVRELYGRQPEAFYLEAYEVQALLWSFGYTDDLAGEGENAAVVEVSRTYWP